MSLPTLYDLSTPASNLASFEESLSALSFDLEPYRITWGQGVLPAVLGAVFGKEQGGFPGLLIGAFVGYMAPLPMAAIIAGKAVTSWTHNQAAFAGYSPRRRRKNRRRR